MGAVEHGQPRDAALYRSHDDMGFNLRVSFRRLLRQPMLTTAVVITVGLAIAANTALFSIFDGLLFRPLPFPNADRIVHVEFPLSVRRSLPRVESRRLSELLAETPLIDARALAARAVILDEGSHAASEWKLRAARVSPALLRLLGVQPIAGRLLEDADARAERPFSALREPGGGWTLSHMEQDGRVGPRTVMLSYDLFHGRYGGDASLIGKPIALGGAFFSGRPVLVGVMPPDFHFPDGANVWVPTTAERQDFNFARLAPGATAAQLEAVVPGVRVTPLREYLRPDGALAVGVLLSATGLLLLITWVQAGALMFSTAAGRVHEIGVHLALGAGRVRLMLRFLLEGALLAIGALGLAASMVWPLTAAVVRMMPEEMTRGQFLSPDTRTMTFAVTLSVCGLLLLVAAPFEILRRTSVHDLLTGRLFENQRVRPSSVRGGIVVVQLTITAALLYLCALTAQSFAAVSRVDMGFEAARVWGLQMPPHIWNLAQEANERRVDIERHAQRSRDTLDMIRKLRGVEGAAYGLIPFAVDAIQFSDAVQVTLAGREDVLFTVRLNRVTTEYPAVLGLRPVAGRLPTAAQVVAGEPLALINATFARALAPHGDAVGQRLAVGKRIWRISGVVEDFFMDDPDRAIPPQLLTLTAEPGAHIVVKLADGPEGQQALQAIRTGFERIWPDKGSRDILRVSGLADSSVADERARVSLLFLIAALSLPLAGAGVTGALGDVVRERMPEIGLRVALGAAPRDIALFLLRTALRSVTVGVFLGLTLGAVIAHALRAHMFGVGTLEPLSVVAAALVLIGAGLTGTLVPVRRAMRIRPAAVLKNL